MLEFFRRYQRYFFYVITFVIVISFSFFGTYSSLSDGSFREQIAFTDVNGRSVTRHELDEMVAFIGTDTNDKALLGGNWGPNFLNDGVVRDDFLKTGLASMLAEQYAALILPDLQAKLVKEKTFTLYSHPQAPFINVESAWNKFSTGIPQKLAALRKAEDPIANGAFDARVALYLGEKQFPSQFLRQVLRYQEQEHSWITPDPNLNYTDLSLFGYHTAEDWFGPRFMRVVAEFIINAAAVADQKGYHVSKADALADLIHNAEVSFKQNANNPNLGVASSGEYFSEQLRRMGMDQNRAAKIWGQVLQFRRLFQDMGHTAFVDPQMFQKFNAYASESVSGELFRLPAALRFNNFRSLQKFEAYLDAVSKRPSADALALPSTFLKPQEVNSTTPELVQKRYLLEIAQVDKKNLQLKVAIKDSWNWETDDKHWELLKKEFPELGAAKATSREERFAVLDALDTKTRTRIDDFARAAIVDSHPEWLEEALANAPTKKNIVGLSEKGGKLPVDGLENGKELIRLLDEAPLAGQQADSVPASAKKAADKLAAFSANGKTYYRIAVIERAPGFEILTFAEANNGDVLDKLVDRKLEEYYQKNRDKDAKAYKRDDGSWKPLAEVRESVANAYFANTLKAIEKAYAAAIAPKEAPQQMIGDFAATLRFYPYVKQTEEQLRKQPELAAQLTQQASTPSTSEELLEARKPLADQWKLERSAYQAARSTHEDVLDKAEVFSLAVNDWTQVRAPASGDVSFFHLERKGDDLDKNAVAERVTRVQQLLSDESQRLLMGQLLKEFQSKQAISLDYLNQVAEVEFAPETEYQEG